MPYNPWPDLIVRGVLYLATLAVVGWGVGQPLLILFLGTLAYLIYHLIKVARLEFWLRTQQYFKPPQGHGLWESVYDSLYKMQRRHRQRRRRLADIVHAFRETAEAVPDAVVALRDDGTTVWWNSAAEQLLGLRWPADVDRRLDNLFRDPKFLAFFRRQSDRTRQITLPSPVNDHLMLEIRVVPYGGNQRLLIARDVTRLQRLENMRRDFIANVSHELRTPLTVVHGVAETLAESSELPPEEQRMLQLMQQQTTRMSRLVEDLLMLSRLETSPRPENLAPVDVPALLRNLRTEAEALSGEQKHDIRLELLGDCELRADESELRSAFSNLVFNAVKYTPAGGRITLRWWCDDKGAHFAVSDTGVGIAPQHIPRLTERFYRVDRGRSVKTGGTGLGLAIVKHILQRYDGRLTIESELGAGSTFTCHFPPNMCSFNDGALPNDAQRSA